MMRLQNLALLLVLACGLAERGAGVEPEVPGGGANEPGDSASGSADPRHDAAEPNARAKALNTCAVALDSSAPAHTVVSCPKGQAYDHGAEQCFTPVYAAVPAAASDECRNGDMRCPSNVLQVCVNYAWQARRRYESQPACERGMLERKSESIF